MVGRFAAMLLLCALELQNGRVAARSLAAAVDAGSTPLWDTANQLRWTADKELAKAASPKPKVTVATQRGAIQRANATKAALAEKEVATHVRAAANTRRRAAAARRAVANNAKFNVKRVAALKAAAKQQAAATGGAPPPSIVVDAVKNRTNQRTVVDEAHHADPAERSARQLGSVGATQ